MASELYELLSKATQADVDECDAELKRLEEERDKITLQIGKLQELRHVFDVAVNGKAKRTYTKKPKPDENAARKGAYTAKPVVDDKANLSAASPLITNQTSTAARRRLIAEYLIKHGSTRGAVLADALDIPYGSMGGLMADRAFATVKDGYIITPEGVRQYFPKS